MKKTPLKRRTRLKTKTPLRRSNFNSKRSKPKKATKSSKPSMRLLKKKLWAECKRITRERHGNTCYTCGKTGLEGAGWQTGHFIPSSICSAEMRYSLDNLRPQCWRCNINLSGNWPAYEAHLKRDGFDPEELKQYNRDTTGMKYDSLWYQEKIEEYKNII